MNKEKIAKILLEIKAVDLKPAEPFRYASGILSPIYCDNRLLMSYPKERKKVIDFFCKIIKHNNLEFDVICGIATAGITWAAGVAEEFGKPMIYVRGTSKEHGKENQIEGKLEKGQKILVIEDLISTGGSSLRAIESVREAGAEVNDCVAIFTYEMEKATKGFEDSKCNLITLSDFTTLIDIAAKEDYIKEDDKIKVLEWNKDPSGWGKAQGFE